MADMLLSVFMKPPYGSVTLSAGKAIDIQGYLTGLTAEHTYTFKIEFLFADVASLRAITLSWPLDAVVAMTNLMGNADTGLVEVYDSGDNLVATARLIPLFSTVLDREIVELMGNAGYIQITVTGVTTAVDQTTWLMPKLGRTINCLADFKNRYESIWFTAGLGVLTAGMSEFLLPAITKAIAERIESDSVLAGAMTVFTNKWSVTVGTIASSIAAGLLARYDNDPSFDMAEFFSGEFWTSLEQGLLGLITAASSGLLIMAVGGIANQLFGSSASPALGKAISQITTIAGAVDLTVKMIVFFSTIKKYCYIE